MPSVQRQDGHVARVVVCTCQHCCSYCSSAFQNILTCVDYCPKLKRGVLLTPTALHLLDSTPHSLESVWPQPGKEPLGDVDRAVLIAIHHQAAVLTAIRPYPQRHVFLALADMARPGGIAFINDMEFFPKAQTLVDKHLHKAIETPIIIHHAVADLPLLALLGGLILALLDDHLPLKDRRSPQPFQP